MITSISTVADSPGSATFAEAVNLEYDGWLADRIGKDAYRLVIAAPVHTDCLRQRMAEPAENHSFIHTRIPAASKILASQLTDLGFKQVETLVTFRGNKCDVSAPDSENVRWAVEGDRSQVIELARSAFTHSRFHRDPEIADAVADRIKADWADAYFEGTRGTCMAVAEAGGEIAGFTSALENEAELTIDLIAVGGKNRGKNLGRAMIEFVSREKAEGRQIRAGTQQDNVASLRLYGSLGFHIAQKEMTFHWHGT